MLLSSNDSITDWGEEEIEYNPTSAHKKLISINIPEELKGSRLDFALAQIIPEFSRSKLTTWIREGKVLVDNKCLSPKDKVNGNEEVEIEAEITEQTNAKPENIKLNIIFEDENILVINKPKGLVVHPGNGNFNGTILNALLHHYPDSQYLARCGIVHRLDKDTTGLMVIAKTEIAQTHLVRSLQTHAVSRIYRAIVHGHPQKEGIVNKNIGRDNKNRIKMAVLEHGGKPSITHYRVLEYFNDFSYVECKLETGRTHQIRVHMKSIGHPLVGDPLYGSRKTNFSPEIAAGIQELDRQALHALKLRFIRPVNGRKMEFRASIPDDMRNLVTILNAQTNSAHVKNLADFDDEDDGEWEIIYVRE